ncbi:MAG: OmpA family protein [Nitrospirae bacterium]|nr:OmpA family protein [Nitrospirota bacterium]
MQSKNPQYIKIIKRSRRIFLHREGGVWKIAYADFITSMMIFFLSMWLLSLVSNTGKSVFSEYFKKAGRLEDGGASVLRMQFMFEREMKQRKELLKSRIEEKIAHMSDNLMVEELDNGIRIQMMDSQEKNIFESGSARPTPAAEALFKVVADGIWNVPNKITIEGHTDSVPYAKGALSNWELSTMRASAARLELEKNNIPPFRIDRIVGYADTRPIIKNNPADRRNRRISIFIAFEQMKLD